VNTLIIHATVGFILLYIGPIIRKTLEKHFHNKSFRLHYVM